MSATTTSVTKVKAKKMKQCTKCGVFKPERDFYKNRTSRFSWCRGCHNVKTGPHVVLSLTLDSATEALKTLERDGYVPEALRPLRDALEKAVNKRSKQLSVDEAGRRFDFSTSQLTNGAWGDDTQDDAERFPVR